MIELLTSHNEIFIYLGSGIFSGFLAGFFGIGGGLITVPVLSFVFGVLGFPPEEIMHFAVGTSLACIIITSWVSMRSHIKKKNVDLSFAIGFAFSCAVGSAAGSMLAPLINGVFLKSFFGVFTWIMAATMFFQGNKDSTQFFPAFLSKLGGAVIGLVSAILGVGGGAMSVPFLLNSGLDMRKAIGTSAMCGFPISLVGTAGFMMASPATDFQPFGSMGFIVLPAFLAISLTGVFMVRLGVSVASTIEKRKLQYLFGLFLLLVGAKMIFF